MDGYYAHSQLQSQQLQQQMSQQMSRQQQQQQQQQHQHQHQHHQHQHHHGQIPGQPSSAMSMPPPSAPMATMPPDPNALMGASTPLDDMIRDNQNELHRRRSMPHAYSSSMVPDDNPRRLSSIGTADMMAFGGGNGDLGNYQFGQPVSGYPAINTNLAMTDGLGNYVTDPNDYATLSPDMMGSMIPSTFANMNMDPQLGPDSPAMNLFPATSMPGQYSPNQLGAMANDFSMDLNPDDGSLGTTPSNTVGGSIADANDLMNVAPQFPMDGSQTQSPSTIPIDSNGVANYNQSMPTSLSRHVSSSGSVLSPPRGTSHTNSSNSVTQQSSASDATTPNTASTPREVKEKTIYSKSGFDMLKALWLVATRKDPKINLGAVDMSCAFVVCDVSMNDCPIIYVSDNFQNLTGYSRHDIVGQNCRFLQAPDGAVEAGSKREFVDDGAVYNLKKMVHEGREVQQSLINYRKGGKPFLNLLTMIPIPWDTDEIRYFIGFQIDLVECPDAIAGQDMGTVKVNYKHSDIGQYIWTPPNSNQGDSENGQTLGVDDVSTLLQQFNPKGLVSDWHKQSWDKMLLENTDDVVHVLSLKGLFLYLSPACKRVLEYDSTELVGNSLSTVCHPSDIVPVTRELKDTTAGNTVNIVFRIRRKNSGYTWFESHGSLFVEQGKGRKCIILVGRKRPVFTLSRRNLEANCGIGDSELWTKLSTSGMFLFVSSNIRSLLDLQPEALVGTSIQELMRKESRAEFGRSIEKARRGRTVTCKHEVQNRRGQVLQAQTVLYPGDAGEGEKPSFLLAQTKLMKASSRSMAGGVGSSSKSVGATPRSDHGFAEDQRRGQVSQPAGGSLRPGTQDAALASDDNIFDELRTTKCSSWQFELRQMEKVNRILAEELGGLLSNKKKRKRRKGVGNVIRDCANCHTRNTPEWRRGPSGQRDLCNSCGLRWAKQTGRVSPRNSSRGASTHNGDSQSKKSASPIHSSPLHKEVSTEGQVSAGINPSQLTAQSVSDGSAAPSGAASATGVKPSTMMPPPSHSSLMGSLQGPGMTSIREERENSQP